MVKISVVMPVYNTKEEYLRSAIESILQQNYTDFEFIIVNDGSTNNSEEIILSYSDPRIKYIKQNNKGAASARNTAWDVAAGTYIANFDSDDIASSDRLEKQLKFLDENPSISLVGSWVNIIGSNRLIKVPKNVRIMDLISDCAFFHSSIMLRKFDFEKYKLKYDINTVCTEDYDLYSRAVQYLKMANLQEALVGYRVYPENLSSQNKDIRIISSFEIQDRLLDYLSTDQKVREKIIKVAYLNKSKTNNKIEQLFSIKNLYKNWAKYKLLTILGMEICWKVKTYRKDV